MVKVVPEAGETWPALPSQQLQPQQVLFEAGPAFDPNQNLLLCPAVN